MTKTYEVSMPQRLCRGRYYDSEKRSYCALGYIMRHLYKASPQETVTSLRRLREDFPDLYETGVADRNDDAPTNKARLQGFRKTCRLLGITIIERTPKKRKG